MAARVVLAFATYGVRFDIDAFRIVDDALRSHPGAVYETMRWPYPPGLFPWVLAAGGLSRSTGLPFHGVIQLPEIAADGALTWLVWLLLRRWGASARTSLAAAALVAAGPSFWIISGYHGQIDSLVALPCVLALLAWTGGARRRWLAAGLLIGVGAAIKTVPIFMVLALIPSARSPREAAGLAAAAVAVPLAALAPWLIGDHATTLRALQANHAIPGIGGPSLLVHPSLSEFWVQGRPVALTSLDRALTDAQPLLVVLAALGAGAWSLARRADPRAAAALIWLVVVAVNPNFNFNYLVWALPFLLLAGYVREVALLQLVLLIPEAMTYGRVGRSLPVLAVYVPLMLIAWAALTVGALLVAHRFPRGAREVTRA